MKKILSLLLLLSSLSILPAKAVDYVYFGFEPDIITNYVAVKKKLGYVRLTVELMMDDANKLAVVEHHAPLLRDAIITIIGQQPADKIRSIRGRNEIKEMCEEKIKSLLTEETGKPVIKKILFTQWLDN